MPAYIESGHILYAKKESVRQGSLWAVPFDPVSMKLTGSPRPVQNAVAGRDGSAFAVDCSGTLVYLPQQGESVAELVLLEPDGSRVLGQAPEFSAPRFSNDGKRVAATKIEEGKGTYIWIYGIESGVVRQFSKGGNPLWDPDDESITFERNGLIRQTLEGTKLPERLIESDRPAIPDAWINEGQVLVYHGMNAEGDIITYGLEDGQDPRQIFERAVAYPNITIDEKWVAFCPAWPKGIAVGPFPDLTFESPVTNTGHTPRWRRGAEGKTRLYYQDFNKLWAVSVDFREGISFGKPESVADLGYPSMGYDVDSNGRIVFIRRRDKSSEPPVLMMNWISMLKWPL